MSLADWLRTSGGVLQVAGITTVAVEIWLAHLKYRSDKPRLFRVVQWIRERFRRHKDSHVQVHAGTAVGIGSALGIRVLKDPAGLDTSAKIEELFRRIEYVNEDIVGLRDNVQQQRREMEVRVRDEREQRSEADAALRKGINELATGNIRIRWWGVALLILGVVLATWPGEIAGWFE